MIYVNNCEPGYTKEAFDTLKIKVQGSELPVICSLVFDEMAIRKSLIWDPRKQKYYGRVDYGHNIDSDSVNEASQALLLQVNEASQALVLHHKRNMENAHWIFLYNIAHRGAKKWPH